VTIGQIGDFKKEIAIVGDTVNTAARIAAETRPRQRKFLISETLQHQLATSSQNYRFEDLGEISLRGKEKGLRLFSAELAPAKKP
jgi:adenylate cyclase